MAIAVDLQGIVSELMRGWLERTPVAMPASVLPGFSASDARAVGEGLRETRIARGDSPAGYKVGFTNAGVRAQFGADGLLAATVYRETISSERSVAAAAYLGPRIEPEVVVGIEAGDVAWAALGFEIVQSHARDWQFIWTDAIADFGLHAALVIGERRAFAPSAAEQLNRLRVRLSRDGEVVERGGGSDIDGGPLGSVRWLRGELARYGRTLRDGEVVSTGSLTRVPALASGERWTVECEGAELPPLSIDVV